MRRLLIAGAVAAAAVVAICLGLMFAQLRSGGAGGSARIPAKFELIDQNGRTVREKDLLDKPTVVFFGYTFCPDACPTDLTTMMRGFDQFAKDNPGKAGKVQPIFVSVDPARDTPPRVGEFAAAFSPRLLGLTGSEANVAKAAKVFAVWYAKGEQTPGGYLVNHTRIAYLMDPDGKPLVVLATDKGPKAVAADLAEWVD